MADKSIRVVNVLEEKVKRQIVKSFGLEALKKGQHEIKNIQGEIIDSFYVSSYWIANILTYYDYPLEVCIVHADKWCKGLLLIPPIFSPLATFDESALVSGFRFPGPSGVAVPFYPDTFSLSETSLDTALMHCLWILDSLF
jgi:hypothetical protein